MADRVELYTSKFETTMTIKTAKLAIIASAQKGSVEDVNEAMNLLAAKLRELDEEKK